MPVQKIAYDEYIIKAFLDTNVLLECKPLSDLPWEEVHADGPIIALVTPTAMKEIDSKKKDGRIGKRAREFNRLIGPVAKGGSPVIIRDSNPRVELALSRCSHIPWSSFVELDQSDGDSCIVAEILCAKDMTSAGKILLSHDIKPIALSVGYEIDVLHVSDDWLRPTEPSPHQKENQKLIMA